VDDARALVHAVAGLDKRLLVAVHELRPALGHQHDLEFGLMPVPAGALFRCHVGFDKVRDDLALGGRGDAEVAIQEEVAQAVAAPGRVPRLDVREPGGSLIRHEAPSWRGS
jgi:hypothetical protein